MNDAASHLIDLTTADTPDTLAQAAGIVLAMVGLTGQPTLTSLAGGRNNRVYRVDVAGRSLVMKAYFQHPDDLRDRLDAEFAFLKHAWSMGVRCVPQPVARLPMRHLALLGLLPGRPWRRDGSAGGGSEADGVAAVTADHVRQAADFALAIQPAPGDGDSDDRPGLPAASDACLSLAEHVASIERRLSQLATLSPRDTLDEQAIAFTTGQLIPAWQCAASVFRHEAQADGLPMHQPIDDLHRVVSPSDFGFHNALLTSDGRVNFLDFEYAGWDDPAKLVCDFFTQVAVPVPAAHRRLFIDRFVAALPDASATADRVRRLLPMYRLKWCAMTLGAFLPVSAARRAFAQGVAHDARAGQLEMAAHLLEQYGHDDGGTAAP